MRRSLLLGSFIAAALWLAPGESRAERLRFVVDPVRSTLAVAPATELRFSAGAGLYGIGSRTFPVQAPSGGVGGTLPNGAASNGLTTSIDGFFIADLNAGPTTIRFVPGASRLGLGTSGSWLPGPPMAPTTPTAGDLAFEFDDATYVWGTNAVLRDAQASFESQSPASLAAAGAGMWTFAAGCDSGCPSFRLSETLLDVSADRLGTGRTGLRRPELEPSLTGTQGQLRSLGSGRYEATIPIDIAITLGAAELHNPLTQSVDLALTGQIVAVPEPNATLQMVVVLATFGLLAGSGLRRRGAVASERRRELALAMVVAGFVEVGGCPGPVAPDAVPPDETQVEEICDSQDLSVKKDGTTQIVSDPPPSPDCNPDNYTGFVGEDGDREDFTLSTDSFLFGSGLSGNGRCGLTMDLTGATAPHYLVLNQRCFQRIVVPPVAGGNASLLFSAVRLGLGVAANESNPSGSVTVTPPGGAPVVVPATGAESVIPIASGGGTINIQINLTSFRTLGGQGYQGVFAHWLFRPGGCVNNFQCQLSDPLHPFCGGGACHDGGPGDPCDDAASCDHDDQVTLCDEISGTCQPEFEVLDPP